MLESFKDLYEVRKTVRFSLLKQNYEDFCKFENNILKDISFLNSLLEFEDKIKNIQKSNGKKIQDLLSKDIFEDIIKNAFQILKNQICTVVYNKVVFDTKKSEQKQRYKIYLKTATLKDLSAFIPTDYDKNSDYIPEENFYKVKDSEIWYAIKFISKLIIDNDFIEEDPELYDRLSQINRYNPNFWNFFELNTFNPFTVNRWKISEIVNSYEVSLNQYKETLAHLNKDAYTIADIILNDKYFNNCQNKSESDGTVRYLFHIFSNCKNSSEKNIWQINHLILLVNKYESLKNGKKKYTNDEIEPKIKILNKELRQLAKVRSELLWYQIHLIDNFQTEKFSFLIQSWKYYFVGMKKIWWENNLSQFQKFIDGLEGSNDKLLYLDSMTWKWFKKLFLSKQSDVVFTDGTRIKDLNGSILAKEEEILQLKKWIIEKIEKDINTFIPKVRNDIFDEINSKEKIKFIEYLSQKWKKVDNLFKLWKKNKKQLIYGKELKEFCNSLYNFDSIKEQFNLDNLEKKYSDLVQKLLIKIKDKKYEIWKNNFKSLSFLWDNFKDEKFKNLDDLKNYFNDSWYKVIQKNVDLEKILKQVKAWELEIFQIKSKDMPFHQNFINDKNCWIIDEVKTEKGGSFKKDLNTLYFEKFFQDIAEWNQNTRIGADFKIRWINSSENNDYESFWKKEKNQLRHLSNKENIEKFQNRFKRDRYSIEFSINLNATNHLTEEDFNTKISNKLKEKRETWSLRILSLDHGESSFLTYKIYQVEGNKYSIINQWWNFDNFKEIQDWEDKTTKRQENIQIDEKAIPYEDQKILDNYITKYHAMIQDQKRERQVEEAIKHFARKSISKIKEIISTDTVDKNKEWVSNTTKESVRKFIQYTIGYKKVFSLSKKENSIRNKHKGSNKSIENEKNGVEYSKRIEEFFQNKRLDVISLWEDTIIFDKINIFHILDYEFHFSYIKQEEWFIQKFPDQENIKEKIDEYLNQIQELLDDENKLIAFCNEIKNSFDWVSLADIDKLYNTPFYSYKANFSLQLEQINNLKKWYVSALIGTISKWVRNWDIDVIALENNLLYYGVDNSKSFQKHMWAENHATFAEALINKLSFCLDKETSESYQFCYPIKVKDRKKLEDKNNWILFFINQDSTSLHHPWCDEPGKRIKWKDKYNEEEIRGKLKDNEELFLKISSYMKKNDKIDVVYCNKCNFCTIDNEDFSDWDELAAYNIAKRALDLKNPKTTNETK